MNTSSRIPVFFLALFCAATLHAKDPADYRVGEMADQDLVASAAFEAVDAGATAAKKTDAAKKIPVILRDFSASVTNGLAGDFSAAFASARTNFQAAAEKKFRSSRLRDHTIASKAFADFVANYDLPPENFPVSTALAAEWARGRPGDEIQNQLLDRLMQTMQAPVCAGPLPADFSGGALCLVSVNQPDEAISVASISDKNKIIAATNLVTLAAAQNFFRENFPAEEQTFAAALANFLRSNCAPDLALTQQFRDRAVRDLTVTAHFAAGQIVVPRGTVIDENTKNILAQMPRPVVAPPPVQNNFTGNAQVSRPANARDFWLETALAIVSMIAAVSLFFCWKLSRARPVESQVPARIPQPGNFSPQIAEVIKAALVQELAATRVELLKAQQSFSTKNISPNGHETKNGVAANPAEDQAHFVQNLIHEGQSRLTTNELEAALKCFDTAVTLQPGDAETFVKMGGVLEKMDRIEEAFACYDRAIALDGKLTVAYLQKGGLLNRLARYSEATQCYERALTNQEKPVEKSRA